MRPHRRADRPQPLHQPVRIDIPAVTVCAHCWDLATLDGPLDSTDIPQVLLWPCPTSERTLDLVEIHEPNDEQIEQVARVAHFLEEDEYPEDEREPFDDLDTDDRLFLLHSARRWLVAMAHVAASP